MNNLIITKEISDRYQEEHDVVYTQSKEKNVYSLANLSLGALLILLSLYAVKSQPSVKYGVSSDETLITKALSVTNYSMMERELKTSNYSWISAKGLAMEDEIYTDYFDVL
jgi:hypothetical protein